jgi:integrase
MLKSSWTKGGKERTIPIRTEAQREVLNRARRLAGLGSLVPSNRNYVQQLRIYEGHTLRAGLSNMHGLRHAYAQNRYEELTGWKAPACGGPDFKTLTPEQRKVNRGARLTISRELGHERTTVTNSTWVDENQAEVSKTSLTMVITIHIKLFLMLMTLVDDLQ